MTKDLKRRTEYLQLMVEDLVLAKKTIENMWDNSEIGTNVSCMLEDFIDKKLKQYQEKIDKAIGD